MNIFFKCNTFVLGSAYLRKMMTAHVWQSTIRLGHLKKNMRSWTSMTQICFDNKFFGAGEIE